MMRHTRCEYKSLKYYIYIYYKYLNNEILAFLFSKQFDTNMKNPWKKIKYESSVEHF